MGSRWARCGTVWAPARRPSRCRWSPPRSSSSGPRSAHSPVSASTCCRWRARRSACTTGEGRSGGWCAPLADLRRRASLVPLGRVPYREGSLLYGVNRAWLVPRPPWWLPVPPLLVPRSRSGLAEGTPKWAGWRQAGGSGGLKSVVEETCAVVLARFLLK